MGFNEQRPSCQTLCDLHQSPAAMLNTRGIHCSKASWVNTATRRAGRQRVHQWRRIPPVEPAPSARPPPTASSPHRLASAAAAHIIDANGKGRAAIHVDGACYHEWGDPNAQRQRHKDQFKSQPQTGWQPFTHPPPPAPSCRCIGAHPGASVPPSAARRRSCTSVLPCSCQHHEGFLGRSSAGVFSFHISWSTMTPPPPPP